MGAIGEMGKQYIQVSNLRTVCGVVLFDVVGAERHGFGYSLRGGERPIEVIDMDEHDRVVINAVKKLSCMNDEARMHVFGLTDMDKIFDTYTIGQIMHLYQEWGKPVVGDVVEHNLFPGGGIVICIANENYKILAKGGVLVSIPCDNKFITKTGQHFDTIDWLKIDDFVNGTES